MLSPTTILLSLGLLHLGFLAIFLLYLSLANFKKNPESTSRRKNLSLAVLIPIRNEPPRILEKLAKSIRILRGNDVVTYVLDDSDEEYREVVDKYLMGNATIVRRDHARGYKPGALNNALKKVNEDVLVIIDADTVVGEDFINSIKKYIPSLSYIQAKTLPKGSGITYLAYLAYIVFRNNILLEGTAALGCPLVAGYGYAIKKDVIEEVGGWDEDILAEDIELSARLSGKGFRGTVPNNVYVYDESPLTLISLRHQQERWIVGTFQTAKKILFGDTKYGSLKKRFFWLTLSTLFTGLIDNVVIACTAILSWVLFSPPSTQIFILLSTFNNIILLVAFLPFINSLIRELGPKKAMLSLLYSTLLYNSLSLKSMFYLIKVFRGFKGVWKVTRQTRTSIREIVGTHMPQIMLFSAGLYASLISAPILAGWISGVLASSAIILSLEIGEWRKGASGLTYFHSPSTNLKLQKTG